MVGILLFLGDRLFLLAVLFGTVAAIGWIVAPTVKGIAYLLTSPRIRTGRARAVTVTVLLLVLTGAALTLVPVPFRSRAEGVVWLPDEAHVRAEVEGFIERVVAAPGAPVRLQDVLVELRDPALRARQDELAARRREMEARYVEQQPVDRVKAEMIREDWPTSRTAWMRSASESPS